MRASRALLFFLGYSAIGVADPVTLTIGDKALYSHTGSAAATPTGDHIAVEGTGNLQDGVDIYLSSEIQEKIKKIVKSDCEKDLNSKCYNEVQDIFERHETGLVARSGVIIGAGIAGLAGIFFPLLYHEQQPSVIHIPIQDFHQATQLPKATEIVVKPEHGSPITVNPSPRPTATGSATVTTYAAAGTDHAKGDMGIIIPKGLAKKLDDYLNKESVKNCKSPDEFKKKLQRRLGSLSAPICPTEMVAANEELMNWAANIAPTDITAVFRNEDARRAMNTAIGFIRDNAVLLALSSEQAETVATMLYYLVYVKTVYNEAISTVNVIRADDIKEDGEEQTTKTCSSKTTATNCDVGCEMAGNIIGCETTCSETTACTKTTGTITTTKVVAYTPVPVDVSTTSTTTPTPKCDVDKISKFPANLFKQGIYAKFCSELKDIKKEQIWTVDSAGAKTDKKRRDVGDWLGKRTPPASSKNYPNYRTALSFKPSKDGSKCDLDCSEAYSLIADSNCGRTAGEQNIMASEGSVDVGCGTYSYSINSETDGKLKERVCHGRNKWGKFKDVHENELGWMSFGCLLYKDKDAMLKAGSKAIENKSTYGSSNYHLIFSWIDGCEGPEQDLRYPFGKDNKSEPTCKDLIYDNWKKCNNGGAGGYIDQGCVRYEFRPTFK